MVRRILGLAVVIGGAVLTAALGQTTGPSTMPVVKVSVVGDAYKVEGNIAYDQNPQTVLDVISPKAALAAGEKRPGVIMFHGAGWVKSEKASMAPYYNLYLGKGFVVCNVEYREPRNAREGGGGLIPVVDSYRAAHWFFDHAEQYGVDQEKIVVTGTSGGGYLVLMVGMSTMGAGPPTGPDFGRKQFKVAAIVNCYGATDLAPLIKASNEWALLWHPPERLPNAAVADPAQMFSPMTYVRKDVPPVLTIQGERDQVIPLAQGEALTKALQDAGAEASIHVMKESYHGFTMERMPEVAYETFDGFLAKHGIVKASGATGPAPYHGVPPYN